MNIREANLQDARDIAKIHVEAWQIGYKGLMPKEFLGSLSIESKTAQWADALTTKDPGTNLVYIKDGLVVGFCVFGPSRDSDLPNNHGELVALNILPEYWSNGFGTKLLLHVIEVSKNRKWDALYLWVIKQNTRARSIYEGFGFLEDGTERVTTKLTGNKLHEVRYVNTLQ